MDEMACAYTDSPEFIVDGSIKAQRDILSGYKKHKQIDPKQYAEALNPNHAAISLTGEPTLYPHLSELIEEFHRRDMTTFLVTNGVLPQALSRLKHEPSQLYISLHAPDEETFTKTCRPLPPKAWQGVTQTLKLLKNFSCPSVLRLTLARGLNMDKAEEYAKLIDKADSTYVEAKAYFYVGFSRKRLNFENMPTHHEVKTFAEELSNLTGYRIIDDESHSRVVLLSRIKKPVKLESNIEE
jgi:tRNA wybutosine-synthesizing protein 1